MPPSTPAAETVPDALLSVDQWLCWQSQSRSGKPTKVPLDPTSPPDGFASTTDATTWSDFETARAAAVGDSHDADGIGFVFTDDDPFVGVDLDDCRDPDDGTTAAWAQSVINTLESFTEISPSGTGYHVLVRGELPAGRNRHGDLEIYETARFFTVTGDHVSGMPATICDRGDELAAVHETHLQRPAAAAETETEQSTVGPVDVDDQTLLDRAMSAANGEKFTRLWNGRTVGYESHSEADMALCSMLAFWTGGDDSRVDQLFRASGLFRDKWDERHFADGSTYGEKTVERAVAGTDEYYQPPASDANQSSAERESDIAVSDADSGQTADESAPQVAVYLDRIETLAGELQTVRKEADRLEAELEAERQRRQELETELAAERESESLLSRSASLFRP